MVHVHGMHYNPWPIFVPLWIVPTLLIGLIGVIMLKCENLLPPRFTVLFKYGKTLVTPRTRERHFLESRLTRAILVPKKYFSHFYAFAVISHMILALYVMYRPVATRRALSPLMYILFGNYKYDGMPAYFFIMLFLLHVTRRFFECVFLAAKSEAKINIIHYITGFAFYTSILLFNANSLLDTASMHRDRRYSYWIGVLLFLIGQIWQFNVHIAFANLRNNPPVLGGYRCNTGRPMFPFSAYQTNEITRKSNQNFSADASIRRAGYYHPRGRLFRLVSCPNFTAELVIYTGLFMLTGYNENFFALYFWVIVNQIVSAKMTHAWYREAYNGSYPLNRKAIIPWLI